MLIVYYFFAASAIASAFAWNYYVFLILRVFVGKAGSVYVYVNVVRGMNEANAQTHILFSVNQGSASVQTTGYQFVIVLRWSPLPGEVSTFYFWTSSGHSVSISRDKED